MKMHRITPSLLIASAITLPLVAGSAHAQETAPASAPADEANAHYEKGRELYRAGNYAEALKELEAAYKLNPSPALLYNIAKTRERVGDRAGAIEAYRSYLQQEPNAPDRGDVEHLIKSLQAQQEAERHALKVDSTPPGAEVFVDDATHLVGQTPLSIKLAPGAHKVWVRKAGFEEASRDIALPPGQDLALSFDLRPLQDIGYLSIDADQEGAHIFLDGTVLALTPYREKRALPAGPHQVVLEREGYERVVQMVDIQKDKVSRLQVRMASTEGRSKAPLLLGPLGGSLLIFVGLTGAALSSLFGLEASASITGTLGWGRALLGFGAGTLLAALLVVGGLALGSTVVGIWIARGIAGDGSGSEVIVEAAPAATTQGKAAQ